MTVLFRSRHPCVCMLYNVWAYIWSYSSQTQIIVVEDSGKQEQKWEMLSGGEHDYAQWKSRKSGKVLCQKDDINTSCSSWGGGTGYTVRHRVRFRPVDLLTPLDSDQANSSTTGHMLKIKANGPLKKGGFQGRFHSVIFQTDFKE